MTSTTAITGIFGGENAPGSPTDQGLISFLVSAGGSPTDQGGVTPLFPTGGSPTDQGNPPPAPIDRLLNQINTITFTQDLAAQLTLNVDTANALAFGDTTLESTKYGVTANTILFGQILEVLRVLQVSTSNEVTFNALGQRTYEETVSNTLTFGTEGDRKITADNLITFSQQIIADASKTIGNDVVFDSSVTTTKILNISISNIINFTNYVVGIGNDICDRNQFASTCLPAPTFTRRSTIILQCDVDTIEIRNPELGNTESTSPRRALNETRYGSITMYRNPVWPKKTVLEFDITTITKSKALELHDFLFNCLGKEVTLTDHESRVWVGVITNPEAVIEDLSAGDCNYSTNLVFEGEPQ